jgi:serine/threonine protein kinase
MGELRNARGSEPDEETDPMAPPPTVHPTDQTLQSYGLGKLDDASAESVNEHLEGRADCRRRIAEITSDSFLGRLCDANARPESSRPAVSSTDGLSLLDRAAVVPNPPPASSLPPGLADLPDYEILRELGQGGMGVVYLAQNTLMGRTEVLKVVSGHLVNRRGVLDRFLGEIRNAAKLHHPNIVAAYTAIRLGESLVLAMEYVEGLDLSRMVKAAGPLPVANACNYVHQAALGLQHAHERGMVHRDIKPSNLMLAKQGNRAISKILDFGLAKVQSEGAVDGGLTHEGQMLGTPDYIAPEQISNARRADIRADIYSLGCTLYYLLTGKPPFQGASLYDILQAHHSMDAAPLNLVRPEVPTEVAVIVAKMMSKEPERRFQEPKEVAQALKPFFKAGNVAVQGQSAEVSRAGQMGSGRPMPGLVSTPTQPATNDERPAVRPRTAAGPSSPEAAWQSLIDLGETERSRDGTPAVAPRRRPPWVWLGVTASILLLGLVAAWAAGVFKVKTANGVIVVENVPADAVVEVDGGKITITPKEGQPVRIEQPPGKYFVRVKHGGDELLGESVLIESGEQLKLRVRLERPTALGAAERAAADGTSSSHMSERMTTSTRSPAVRSAAPPERDGAGLFPARVPWGDWSIISGELVLSFKDGWSTIEIGEKQFQDVNYEVECMRVKGDGLITLQLMCYGALSPILESSVINNAHRVKLAMQAPSGYLPMPPPRVLGPAGYNEWHRFRIEHHRGHTRILVDDRLVYEDRRDGFTPGIIRLNTNSAEARFRPIKVTDPDGKVLAEGLPILPSGPEKVPGAVDSADRTSHSVVTRSPAPTVDRGVGAPAGVVECPAPAATPMPKFGGPTPLACWTFETDSRDVVGTLHGKLINGAQVRDGQLHLDGKGAHLRTEPLSRALREKTLEAWVMLPNLLQRGVGVMSIWHAPGTAFDAIVLGEREPGKWIAGSNFFQRTEDLAAPVESAKPTELIHLAIVYDVEGGVTLFRQGRPYGERYVPKGEGSTLQTYPAGESHVLFGLRGLRRGILDPLRGAIEEARLYDRALTAHEVATSYRAGVIHLAPLPGSGKVPGPIDSHIGKEPGQPLTTAGAGSPNRTARVLAGSWRVEGDELLHTNEDVDARILLSDAVLMSYDMTFNAKIISGDDGFAVIFHRMNDHDWRGFHIGDNGRTFNEMLPRRKSTDAKRMRTVTGRWYGIRIEVRNARYTCYLDGREVFQGVDQNFTRGGVGLIAYGTVSRFKDIVITTPERRILWSGPPNRLVDAEGQIIWEAPANQRGGARVAPAGDGEQERHKRR